MTAELALALPAVVLLIAVVFAAARVVTAQVQCVDAARAGARVAARGEAPGVVIATATQVGPAGARVQLATAASTVTVGVSATVHLPLPGSPALAVSSTASAPREPGAGGLP
ncbi:MAG: TadE family type IV pilus minor pilin [Kineosporiaceae bacterium]